MKIIRVNRFNHGIEIFKLTLLRYTLTIYDLFIPALTVQDSEWKLSNTRYHWAYFSIEKDKTFEEWFYGSH